MTTLAALPADRIELDPSVPHPPFPVWLSLPASFHLLDTNPATWQRSTDILIREAFYGDRLSSAERRGAFGVLEQLVVNCQRGGVAVSVVRLGRLSDGQVASAGIHLAWAQERQASSLGRVRDMLPRSGISEELPTPVGPAIIHRSRANAQVPGTAKIVAMARIQLFVPIPNTNWTVILSTASAFPELTSALDKLMVTIAGTVRTEDPDLEPANEPDPAGWTEFVAANPAAGPGITRGFGTFVRKRVGPADGAHSADTDRPAGRNGKTADPDGEDR